MCFAFAKNFQQLAIFELGCTTVRQILVLVVDGDFSPQYSWEGHLERSHQVFFVVPILGVGALLREDLKDGSSAG